MIDLALIFSLGFLGSFGHCVGMCGPIAMAFALSAAENHHQRWPQIRFHLLLNLGRLLSYTLVGGAIGALGSVLVASGQLAGVGSDVRRLLTIMTGLLLIWFGLRQIQPQLLPRLPLLNPFARGVWRDRLDRAMGQLARLPLLLGLAWGMIPCGFLYAAQLKAAQTLDLWQGSATMLAFGLGTVPTMLTMGVVSAWLSRDRRSQLFRLGGGLTVLIGVLLLLRTGDTMGDYSGHGALVCLMLALIARPLHRLWPPLLTYRRLLGVGSFVLSLIHVVHLGEHAWSWQWQAVQFMVPAQQLGIVWGAIAIALLTPAALTSFDWAQRQLGRCWRPLHLLSVPALIFAAGHAVLVGAHYWGNLAPTARHHWASVGLLSLVTMVLLTRSRWIWSWFKGEKQFYGVATAQNAREHASVGSSTAESRPRPQS